MTHCAKCSQPLHLTGPHACSVTRGNAVPEVDLLRAEVFRLGGMLDAALLQVDELSKRIYKIGLLCDAVPGLQHGFCPDIGEPRDNVTRIKIALDGFIKKRIDETVYCTCFPSIPCRVPGHV